MSDQTLNEELLTKKEQSPFLPGTWIQYAYDSTSIGLLKTCPRLYQYTIIDGWQPKGESIHLRFGLEYHQALQEYDISRANGVAHEDAIHDVIHALVERTFDWTVDLASKAGKYKNRRSLIGLVVDYLDHFANDPAQTYLLENGKPAAELSFRFELDWGPQSDAACQNWEILGRAPLEEQIHVNTDKRYHRAIVNADGFYEAQATNDRQPYLLCGHLDRVVTFNDQLLVMDRKTTTTTAGPYYFAQFEPNNQMTLYTLAGRVVLNSPIKGVVIDAAQVLIEDPNKFVRGFTYRTPDQLDEWLQDLQILFSVAETYATEGYWPMNDTACDKFGGCRFRDVCSKSPGIREQFLKADFIQLAPEERWNPLKAR